jgi:CRISPR-associated Cas5-like protein
MRHVELTLFAVFVCQKFAAVTAFSWHLPHPQAMNGILAVQGLELQAKAARTH